ncbi:DUF2726 domain-containing protein [Brevundimonas naejangsanensis]|uniref:DUF2726 domain-containing protein n=1 Tax=Brevundimonas naejangsanensis TaxID=588932 RepID=UPI003207BDDF
MTILRLVNRYEEIAHGEIQASADRWGMSVYPKVRVADVISLDDVGAVGELKRFGLQGHFDFVVCKDTWRPIYAVEFDGDFHSTQVQAARDAKKDELCKRAEFPILRINSRYLTNEFGKMSLLAWIMDVHEMQEEFHRIQAYGGIAADEPFDPFWLMSTAPGEDRFPYMLAGAARESIRSMNAEGRIIDPCSSGFIGYDADEVVRGMHYIRVSATEGVFVKSAMRPQFFPILFSDLLDEILSFQLEAEVRRWLAGEVPSTPLADIHAEFHRLSESLKLGQSHSYGHG